MTHQNPGIRTHSAQSSPWGWRLTVPVCLSKNAAVRKLIQELSKQETIKENSCWDRRWANWQGKDSIILMIISERKQEYPSLFFNVTYFLFCSNTHLGKVDPTRHYLVKLLIWLNARQCWRRYLWLKPQVKDGWTKGNKSTKGSQSEERASSYWQFYLYF